MVKKMKKVLLGFSILLCLMLMALAFKLQAQELSIGTLAELELALAHQQKDIGISNLDLEGKTITINYSVKIHASSATSTITNGYFKINGSITDDYRPTISFSNIIFDGGIDYTKYDLTKAQSFDSFFGSDRDEAVCINGDYGYYELLISNCEFTRYAAYTGPCLYAENTNRDYEKRISIEGCKFHHNIAKYDTIHLSNDKLNLKLENSEFYNNFAYKAAGISVANAAAELNKLTIRDNYFCPFDESPENLQSCGGGIFIGGNNITLKNSVILNNETNYGGGLGVSSSFSGNKQIVVENVVIKNNKAKFGGAVSIHSLAGQTISFINCDFSSNTATTASTFYTNVYASWVSGNNGGLINLFFCNILLNEANDIDTFKFYNSENTKGNLGTFNIKGCFIVGADTLESEKSDYNYIATIDEAISSNVLNRDAKELVSTKIITPNKKSNADIKVSSKIYHEWSELLSSYKGSLKVGYNKSQETRKFHYWILIIIGVVVLSACVFFLVRLLAKGKISTTITKSQEEEVASIVDNQKYIKELTERELAIVKLTIGLKKRKEIAEELCFSENTIKKDLSSIYYKLKVKDKSELIAKYKDLI